ncbi:peptidase inhibitor family I36 protein [Actinokineospora cianjurensis]|uniref:Peptidase inhibitor family I36 n=1 Tax=Actinokineospora cianjurensis TaxID=585224 RepID=A0A421AXR8_9PSEU|nr:peptidase inhibitor family I36 protein [Actinokineospora cianjurensis]RLK54657.1 peptidase inhibitor family I36 [Actinokineospora cianjurensis]
MIFSRVCAALLTVLALLGLVTPAAASPAVACERGELCLWSGLSFHGESGTFGIGSFAVGECLVLGRESRSLANLLRHDVTVYESSECATESDFTTYPGLGTYVPATPFVVRAIQIWPT